MQLDRELGKRERLRLIGSLVARKRIGTQLELATRWLPPGCRVTQATISRDLRELGLEKGKDSLGRPRYVAPHRARRADPRESLAGVLRQFAREATAAQNLVVVASELGRRRRSRARSTASSTGSSSAPSPATTPCS